MSRCEYVPTWVFQDKIQPVGFLLDRKSAGSIRAFPGGWMVAENALSMAKGKGSNLQLL